MAAPRLEIVVNNVITLLEATRNFAAQPDKMERFINIAQVELQNYLLGAIPSYRPGSPTPAVSAQVTSDVAMLLAQFHSFFPLNNASNIIPDYWEIPIPYDYLKMAKLIDIRVKYASQPLESSAEILTNSEFLDRAKSYSKPPTELEPICEYLAEGFRIYPSNGTSVLMVSYKVPSIVTLNIDPITGEFDFVSIGDIRWPEKALPYLTYLTVSKFGLPINNPQMIKIGEELAKMSI